MSVYENAVEEIKRMTGKSPTSFKQIGDKIVYFDGSKKIAEYDMNNAEVRTADSNTLDKAIRNCDYAYGTAEIKDVNGKWVVFHGGKYIQEFDNSDDAEAFVREKGWH